jgi:alpha-tubulin suppressor-like RCC1 family protein
MTGVSYTKSSHPKKLLAGTKSIIFVYGALRHSISHFVCRFVSIVAGDNHLLALTSNGRTFTHPVNKEANRFGQLGLRAFEITDPTGFITGKKPDTLRVELSPKTAENESTKPIRVASSLDVATDLSNIDDSTIHWCTRLYEIPALRGVDISQIAAGGRSSFVRTPTGRVLGWGANEFGWALFNRVVGFLS